MDLAEDLDWARPDERALHRHTRAVREILAPLDPILVCIDRDIAAAFTRAVEQRGRNWFTRQQADKIDWHILRNKLLSEASVAADRVNRAFQAGGWHPTLHIDGTVLDTDDVFYTDVQYLRRAANESQQKKTRSHRLREGPAIGGSLDSGLSSRLPRARLYGSRLPQREPGRLALPR